MVEILEKGEIPDARIIARCGHCKTVFKFSPSEGEKLPHDRREPKTGYRIACPLCGKTDCWYK